MNIYISFLLIFLFVFPEKLLDTKVLKLNQEGTADAKVHFDKGLLLLHNFEYPDAAEEFIIAQQKDPNFVMAYWGEAMTYDHPIWGDLDIEKSRAALQKFGSNSKERLAKTKTNLEKDFIQGLEILFGDGSKPDREKAYAEHMATMYEKYPANHDVAAFYALSLLATKKSINEWEENNIKAAEITNKILMQDPNHAGALHYLVHADDHPRYASNGLDAARRYAKVASYAGHALHMPSHIYLALGMWNDVVQSNEISFQAGMDRKQRKQLTNDDIDYHSHKWLSYGYLQQGRFQRAKELVKNQLRYTNELPSPDARSHLLHMKGHYLFITNEWRSEMADIPVKTDDLDAGIYFCSLFLEGYKFFKQDNAAELEKLIELFGKEITKAAKLQSAGEGIAICGVKPFANGRPTAGDIRNGERLLKALKGVRAWMMNDINTADNFFKELLPKDGAVVIGPPSFLFLTHELYGEFLLANNRPAEALRHFDKALEAAPKRYIGLKGKLTAAKALKDSKTESLVKAEMQEILKQADAVAVKDLW